MSTKVKTGLVRFSYVHVFEKYANEPGQKEKYSVSLLIPKTDTVTLENISRAILAAAEAGKGKWGGTIPSNIRGPLRDGDLEKPDHEEYKGHMFLSANSYNRKPGVIDINNQEIIDPDDFYSGCYGKAIIDFYAYNTNGKGVACGLQHLKKLKDGENLGGSNGSAADAFADDDDDNFM